MIKIALSILFAALMCARAEAQRSPNVYFDVVPAPPPTFDVFSASAQDRIKYSVPPSPPGGIATKASEAWYNAMRAFTNRTPGLPTIVNNLHFQPTGNATHGLYGGVLYNDPVGRWFRAANSTTFQYFFFQVPFVQSIYSASMWNLWAGFDGWNSGSTPGTGQVSQVGIAALTGGNLTNGYYYGQQYYFWAEWYPGQLIQIPTPIGPGQVAYIEMWWNSPTNFTAYYVNENTNQSYQVQVKAPGNWSFKGQDAEVITEYQKVHGWDFASPYSAPGASVQACYFLGAQGIGFWVNDPLQNVINYGYQGTETALSLEDTATGNMLESTSTGFYSCDVNFKWLNYR